MRRIGFVIVGLGALGALLAAGAVVWRRNPRLGSGIVNAVVAPETLMAPPLACTLLTVSKERIVSKSQMTLPSVVE